MSAPISAPVVRIWRVPLVARLGVLLFTAAVAVLAVALWGAALLQWSGKDASAAAAATGLSVAIAAWAWWGWWRPRVVLTTEELLLVNHGRPRRVPLDDVKAVERGGFSPVLRLPDGWSGSLWALSDLAGGVRRRDRGVAELGAAITEMKARASSLPIPGPESASP